MNRKYYWNWACRQRMKFRRGQLPQWQISELKKCGFPFEIWNYLSYEEVKNIIHPLKFRSGDAYRQWWSKNKPNNIPYDVQHFYKERWIGWPDFLNNGNPRNRGRKYLSYEDAKMIVHPLKLWEKGDYEKYIKSSNAHKDLPTSPLYIYKKTGEWISWCDFMGKPERFNCWKTFEEARKYCRSLGIKTLKEWNRWAKSSQRPKNIPRVPWSVYKEKWVSIADWCGFEERHKDWISWKEARTFVREQGIKGKEKWFEFTKTNRMPKNMPVNPAKIYEKHWKGWPDFLNYEQRRRSGSI